MFAEHSELGKRKKKPPPKTQRNKGKKQQKKKQQEDQIWIGLVSTLKYEPCLPLYSFTFLISRIQTEGVHKLAIDNFVYNF